MFGLEVVVAFKMSRGVAQIALGIALGLLTVPLGILAQTGVDQPQNSSRYSAGVVEPPAGSCEKRELENFIGR